jgi:hypothetical protein
VSRSLPGLKGSIRPLVQAFLTQLAGWRTTMSLRAVRWVPSRQESQQLSLPAMMNRWPEARIEITCHSCCLVPAEEELPVALKPAILQVSAKDFRQCLPGVVIFGVLKLLLERQKAGDLRAFRDEGVI